MNFFLINIYAARIDCQLFLCLEVTVISVFVSKSLPIVDNQDIRFLCSQDSS